MANKKQSMNYMMGTLGRGSEERTHINMVIYGRSGAGKTYRAATAPKPYVAAADPRGHDSIPYKVPGRLIRNLSDLAETVVWFEEGNHVEHGIKTLILDGGNFIYDMFTTEKGTEMVEQGRAPDVDRLPYGGGLEVFNPYKRMLLRVIGLTTLEPAENRVHVVLTFLEEHSKDDPKAPFQIHPLFGSKKMNSSLPALFSVIGYIVPVGEDDQGEITQERRMLFTEYRGILARDRLGIFPLMGAAPNLSEYLK